MSIALVLNTTDKYSHIWDAWYHYYKKYWHIDIPVYFLNEKLDCPFPFDQIKVDIQGKHLWTKKLRESVKQIPEDHLFILLEDLFFTEDFPAVEFNHIYNQFIGLDADALRIAKKSKYTTVHRTEHENIFKLDRYSAYLIAHSPNIWRKEFLLECIQVNEDPWSSEIKGTKQLWDKQAGGGEEYHIYHYIKDWFVNVLRHGAVDPKYEHLLNYEL